MEVYTRIYGNFTPSAEWYQMKLRICLMWVCQRFPVAMVACEMMLIRSFYTGNGTTSECVTTRGLWFFCDCRT